MTNSVKDIWTTDASLQLAEVLSSIDDKRAMMDFLRDVLTDKEIVEISARLQAAKMLQAGSKYVDIIKQTKLSSRTVARISAWLQNGTGGYKTAISIVKEHHAHIPPARAV